MIETFPLLAECLFGTVSLLGKSIIIGKSLKDWYSLIPVRHHDCNNHMIVKTS
jgi:hypothetical protein